MLARVFTKADGSVSEAERMHLAKAQTNSSRAIVRQKHDPQERRS